jgi:hypothetical protein
VPFSTTLAANWRPVARQLATWTTEKRPWPSSEPIAYLPLIDSTRASQIAATRERSASILRRVRKALTVTGRGDAGDARRTLSTHRHGNEDAGAADIRGV